MRGRVFDAEVRVRQNRLVEPAADERAEARRVDAVDDGGAAGREPRQRRRRVSVLCHQSARGVKPRRGDLHVPPRERARQAQREGEIAFAEEQHAPRRSHALMC